MAKAMIGTSSNAGDKRSIQILAKSIYKELTHQGYDKKQIVSLATALLGEVTTQLGNSPSPSN